MYWCIEGKQIFGKEGQITGSDEHTDDPFSF